MAYEINHVDKFLDDIEKVIELGNGECAIMKIMLLKRYLDSHRNIPYPEKLGKLEDKAFETEYMKGLEYAKKRMSTEKEDGISKRNIRKDYLKVQLTETAASYLDRKLPEEFMEFKHEVEKLKEELESDMRTQPDFLF